MASPFLPAGAATGCDSGGELSSGDESGEAEFLEHPEIRAPRNLAALFDKAAAHVQGLVQVASREQLLYLYARYKQVRCGGGQGRASAWPPNCRGCLLQGSVNNNRVPLIAGDGCGLGCWVEGF